MLVSGLHCIFSAPISSPASNEVDTDEHANCSITDQDSSHCNACAGSKPVSFTLSPQDFPLNNSTDMEDEMRQAFSGSARLIKASRQVYNQWVSHNMSFLLIPSVTRIPQCILRAHIRTCCNRVLELNIVIYNQFIMEISGHQKILLAGKCISTINWSGWFAELIYI